MNMLSGSPGMKAVERAVEAAILEEFREIERLGGVSPRSKIAISAARFKTRPTVTSSRSTMARVRSWP